MGRHLETKREDQNQFSLMGLKALHLALSCLIFYAFWLLYRYRTIFPGQVRGFRYN